MVSFMDALDPEQAAALYALGVVRRYARGAALFHQREWVDRAIVLLTGRVKIAITTEDGEEVVLAVRDPGDLIGEMSAIDCQPRSASAVALESVEILAVPGPAFTTFLERTPRAALALLAMMASRLREADRKCVEFATQDTMGRVAARLVDLAERYGDAAAEGIRIDLRLSQEELAGWAACSRDAVTRALQAMRELGWITTGRRTISVLQLEALRRRSGGLCGYRSAA
jgi:CRP-like cAMP-binding protein